MVLAQLVLTAILTSCGPRLTKPYREVESSDLEGVWQTDYGNWGVDIFTISSDGTFEQIFEGLQFTDYSFDSGIQQWWIEKLEDGSTRIHLEGARYFPAGREVAELDGYADPCPTDIADCPWNGEKPRMFFDPITDGFLSMVDKVVLQVQMDSSGSIVLVHMWTSSEQGFNLIGDDPKILHRVGQG